MTLNAEPRRRARRLFAGSLADAMRRFTATGVAGAARTGAAGLAAIVVALSAPGCSQIMSDQPRYDPLEASDFFRDGRASRHPVEGTVARGQLNDNVLLHTGKIRGEFAPLFPFPPTREVLERGRERYDIFCSPCHDRIGEGNGMVVQRGYPQPPSMHIPRLRESAPGYLYDVIASGFGRMPSYASQIPVRDRWAIVAYMRALQFSQAAPYDELPATDRERFTFEEASP